MLRLNKEPMELVRGKVYTWYTRCGVEHNDFIFDRIGNEKYDDSGTAWDIRGSWMPVNRLFPYGGEVFKGRVRR